MEGCIVGGYNEGISDAVGLFAKHLQMEDASLYRTASPMQGLYDLAADLNFLLNIHSAADLLQEAAELGKEACESVEPAACNDRPVYLIDSSKLSIEHTIVFGIIFICIVGSCFKTCFKAFGVAGKATRLFQTVYRWCSKNACATFFLRCLCGFTRGANPDRRHHDSSFLHAQRISDLRRQIALKEKSLALRTKERDQERARVVELEKVCQDGGSPPSPKSSRKRRKKEKSKPNVPLEERLKAERDRAQATLAELESAKADAESTRKELTKTKEASRALAAENASLVSRLARTKQPVEHPPPPEDRAKLLCEVDDLRTENQHLRKQALARSEKLTKLDTLEARLKETNGENSFLREAEKAQREKESALRRSKQEAQRTVTNLRLELQGLQNQLRNKVKRTDDTATLRSTAARLQVEVTNVRRKLRLRELEIGHKETAHAEEKKREALRLRELLAKIASLERRGPDAELGELKKRALRDQKAITKLENEIGWMRGQASDLRKQLEESRQRLRHSREGGYRPHQPHHVSSPPPYRPAGGPALSQPAQKLAELDRYSFPSSLQSDSPTSPSSPDLKMHFDTTSLNWRLADDELLAPTLYSNQPGQPPPNNKNSEALYPPPPAGPKRYNTY